MDNGFRWLTVSPKGMDGPNIQPDAAAVLKGLLENGRLGGCVLQTDDCRATYEELIEFVSPPADRFYGVEAILKDNSGNWFSMSSPAAK